MPASRTGRPQVNVAYIRMTILAELLSAPAGAVSPRELERFMRRRGGFLASFRREIEARIDELLWSEEHWKERRVLDRLQGEFKRNDKPVDAYLSESRLGRVLRSPWCALLGLIPGMDAATRAAATAAELAIPAQPRVRSPLAYAAFAALDSSPPPRSRPT